MASFYIPLTGLDADSKALNTIANNLSNMNTTAFKSQKTNFSTLFSQQLGANGAGDPIQLGAGVQVSSNATNFSPGTSNPTGLATDAALNGNGFFVVSNGTVTSLTRAGDFTLGSNGDLVTSDGMHVMGYPAVGGVVNPNGALVGINIPENQVQTPQATTTFGMTATLDSEDPIGSTVPGQVQIYDSLGNEYQATVNFTKTGTNAWSYSITVPDSLQATPPTATAPTTMPVTVSAPTASTVTIPAVPTSVATPLVSTLTPSSSVSGPDTTYSYNFGANGTVDGTTTLTIGGVAVAIPALGESLAALQGQITALGQAGVSAAVNGNVLSILAPTATATAMAGASSMVGDMTGTTTALTFNTGGTVDPTTNLTITGLTAAGATATITAPGVTSGETITQYATALTNALATSNITNVTVTPNVATNQLTITGADVTTANSVIQSLSGSTTQYDFGSTATVDAATNLTITGQTATGTTATMTAPPMSPGETVAQYAAALTTALTNAHIVGVSVTTNGSQLSITGANMTTANSMSQDLSASMIGYNFGSSGGALATVNPGTNLTITGLTTMGSTATTVAPAVRTGETVTQYAAALNQALLVAGIGGVSVTTNGGVLSISGANMTTAGSVIQDPVASLNASGAMTFDSNGNLVSPAANVAGITFAGLSDGAATLNMAWNLLGSGSGKPTISQIATSSSISAPTQDGFASGQYQNFAIGSDGTVTAAFSNGQKLNVGQLALANVANLQGLQSLGNSEFGTTLASGTASIGVSGTNGLGTITGGALEQSNVNISAEFSNLIIAQRGFEANSKAITTFDTITQETINMIH